jgi:plastocyanin
MGSPRIGWYVLFGAVTLLVVVVAIALRGWPVSSTPLRLEAHALSATEFAFSPARLTAPADTRVSLTFANMSQAPHTLVLLPPIDSHSGTILEPGYTDRLDFTTPGPGEYRFVCNVHEGMAGLLVVE